MALGSGQLYGVWRYGRKQLYAASVWAPYAIQRVIFTVVNVDVETVVNVDVESQRATHALLRAAAA